jgi:hypothetical protein
VVPANNTGSDFALLTKESLVAYKEEIRGKQNKVLSLVLVWERKLAITFHLVLPLGNI